MWSVWMLWARCGHDSRVIFWGIISCQSFGYLWMYRVCLLSVEYQGRDDMLCNYYAELSVLHPLKSFVRVAVETFVLLSVMIHCVCSNTQTALNKYTHRASSLFNLQLCHFEPAQMDEGRKVFLNVWAFIKNLEVLLKRSSHRVDYYAPWIKQNCELVNLDWLGSKQNL